MVIRIRGSASSPGSSQEQKITPSRLFEDFLERWAVRSGLVRQNDNWQPAVDVLVEGGNLVLKAEVAGMSEKDVDVRVEGRNLYIKGEKKAEAGCEGCEYYQIESYYGPFHRTFALPETVDCEKIEANCRNGILTVVIPQKPEVKPRTIAVKFQAE